MSRRYLEGLAQTEDGRPLILVVVGMSDTEAEIALRRFGVPPECQVEESCDGYLVGVFVYLPPGRLFAPQNVYGVGVCRTHLDQLERIADEAPK